MTPVTVDLLVEEDGWSTAVPDLEAIATTAASAAVRARGLSGPFEIALLACSDDRIAALNADFRGKAGPTNVLSWPAEDLAPDVAGGVPQPPDAPSVGPHMLGDVAIALQTVTSEAQSSGRPLNNHVLHLIVHGCLHLLGYDHDTPEDAALMEGIETRIMTDLDLPDPYD